MLQRLGFLFLLLLCFTQCRRALLLAYGIRQPAPENRERLQASLDRYSVQDSRLLVFADSSAFVRFHRRRVGLPEPLCFDRQGRAIAFKIPGQSCDAPFQELISSLATAPPAPSDSLPTLREELSRIYSLSANQPFEVASLPEADYYVVVYWAKFIGKLNQKVHDWQSAVEAVRRQGTRIEMVLVNADIQEHWAPNHTDVRKVSQ